MTYLYRNILPRNKTANALTRRGAFNAIYHNNHADCLMHILYIDVIAPSSPKENNTASYDDIAILS